MNASNAGNHEIKTDNTFSVRSIQTNKMKT